LCFKVTGKKVYYPKVAHIILVLLRMMIFFQNGNQSLKGESVFSMDIEKRVRMAVESILENEAIREGLDDSGASALLDWGVSCARNITAGTASVEDDDEAEEASYPRMRALRQMLDIAKSLHISELDVLEETVLLAELLEKAALVYGPGRPVLEQIDRDTFSANKVDSTGENITSLRMLIETNPNF
jgi:hypothetical protein